MLSKKGFGWLFISVAAVAVACTTTFSKDTPDPKSEEKPEICVQPDYAKWASIKEDMTEEEVRQILGKPIREDRLPPELANSPGAVVCLNYGALTFASPAMPMPLEFNVHILRGKVDEKYDPFDGDLSSDGRPTTPKPICPADRVRFSHVPRFVDLRWRPASGKHPMSYHVEVELWNLVINQPDSWAIEQEHSVHVPYCAIHANGRINRWRVKAINEAGESPWSKWSQFEFAQ